MNDEELISRLRMLLRGAVHCLENKSSSHYMVKHMIEQVKKELERERHDK
jgi:hypothetical protein